MAKAFGCKDLGEACSWEGRAETEEELMKMVADHGAAEHNMKEMSEEFKAKIQAAIRDV